MAQLTYDWNVNETGYESGYDQYATTLGQTLTAVKEEAWQFNPSASLSTFYELEGAEAEDKQAQQAPISKDELNNKYNNIGLTFEEDEYPSVVEIMVQQKNEENRRNSIIQRGPTGIGPGIAKFATGLGVSMLDPINIGVSFIPVVGQARFASLVAKQGFTRARLTKGAVEGAVGAALIEPIVYGVAQAVKADYDMMDSFLNLTFGTVMGGGLHVAAGKLKDFNTARQFKRDVEFARARSKSPDDISAELNLYKEYYPTNSRIMRDLEVTDPETRRALLAKSLNDLLTDKPVDVSPIVDQDPILKESSNTSATPEGRYQPEKMTDQDELDAVENTVLNKGSQEIDAEIESIQLRLNELKTQQKDIELAETAETDMTVRTTEDLDEFNAKEQDIETIIKDGINCVNGR